MTPVKINKKQVNTVSVILLVTHFTADFLFSLLAAVLHANFFNWHPDSSIEKINHCLHRNRCE